MMKGWRTVLGMALALAVGLYQDQVGPLPEISPVHQMMAVAAFGLVMRLVTTSPIGRK